MEDVWFIVLQYLYFEKFMIANVFYLSDFNQWDEYEAFKKPSNIGFIYFNLIFTALIGLGGLTTIPYLGMLIPKNQILTDPI